MQPPRQSDGDYRTVAELVRDLRAVYGDLPMYPHSRWFNTRCPGTYDLSRIDRIARGLPDTGHTPPPLWARPRSGPASPPMSTTGCIGRAETGSTR